MVSSRRLASLVCVTVFLVANLAIWLPLRAVITSLTSSVGGISRLGKAAVSDSSSSSDFYGKYSSSYFDSSSSPLPPSTATVTVISTVSLCSTTSTAAAAAAAADDENGAKLYPQVILFGDSITEQGHSDLVPRLSSWYIRRADVVNRGFGGYTTPNGIDVLSGFFPPLPPSASPPVPHVRLMVVFFGANDASTTSQKEHVPLPAYKDALREIAEYEGVRLHRTQLIFISPPPVNEYQLWTGNYSRSAPLTYQYAKACCEVAASLDLPCLNIWRVIMDKTGWEGEGSDPMNMPGKNTAEPNKVLASFLRDGIHLSSEGYSLLADELKALIERELPSEVPDALSLIYPHEMPHKTYDTE